MTINKSQRQSLQKVGLYLSKQVFHHGQLYVALSRVTNKYGLRILIDENRKLDENAVRKHCVQRNLLNQRFGIDIFLVFLQF
jgi:hypothetical protein